MEFEREFNKVDKALSAAALSATIIRQSACSHQDIATLESLVPGMIFDNQWAYGFTNEASLENFQKVKEVVSNAIKTAIAKIKELIKRFMDWIKGNKNISNSQAKEIAKDVENTTDEVTKEQEELKRSSEYKTPEELKQGMRDVKTRNSAACQAWLLSKTPTNKENEAIVKEWLAQSETSGKSLGDSLLDSIVGTFDDATFQLALIGVMSAGVSGVRTSIITGTDTFASDGNRYLDPLTGMDEILASFSEDAEAVEGNTKLFGVSQRIMELHLDTCKNNGSSPAIKSQLKPIEFTKDKTHYKNKVRECIAALFKTDESVAEGETTFETNVDVNKLLTAMVNVKSSVVKKIPTLEKMLQDLEDAIEEEGDGENSAEKLATEAFMDEVRYSLDYCMRLNMLANSIMVGFNRFCDTVKRDKK